jgi:hypothetical protein
LFVCAILAAGCNAHGSAAIPSGGNPAGVLRTAAGAYPARPNAVYSPGAPGPFYPGDTVEYKLLSGTVTCSVQNWQVLRNYEITDGNEPLPKDAKTQFKPSVTTIPPGHEGNTILAITFAKDTPPNPAGKEYETYFEFTDGGNDANGKSCPANAEDRGYVVTAIAKPTPSPAPTATPSPQPTLADCSVKQKPPTPAEANAMIDKDIQGAKRTVLVDLILALPYSGFPVNVTVFDGTERFSNHAPTSDARLWTLVDGTASLYKSDRGEIEPFPDDQPPAFESRRPFFTAPIPGDGGVRNRYSNVGFSWNCAMIDTRSLSAMLKPGQKGELGYIYEGGYAGVSGGATGGTDAGLQVQPFHSSGPDFAAYLLENPGPSKPNPNPSLSPIPQKIALADGAFAYRSVARVASGVLAAGGKTYVATTVDGFALNGSGFQTQELAEVATSPWNVSGKAIVVKRVTSIGQYVGAGGACGANRTVCRLDGSYLKDVTWTGAFVGNAGGASRMPWTSAQGNGFLCYPGDSRVRVAYVSPAAETDSISLTPPVKYDCTR